MGVHLEERVADLGQKSGATSGASGPVADLIGGVFSKRASARGPKYLCLHAALSQIIERGDLRPGAQLPTDDELAALLDLSVGTVQKAMNTLREDGLLDRRQGAGTFVVDPSINMHDLWHFRFLADDGESFLPLKAKAIERKTISRQGPWARHMPGADSYVKVSRLIDVNGEFNLISDFYFDGERFADLASEPTRMFDRIVLRNLLFERYGVRPKSARQLLGFAPLSPRDHRLLKLADGSSGIILETFGADLQDAAIYYQRVVIPQNERKLVVDS